MHKGHILIYMYKHTDIQTYTNTYIYTERYTDMLIYTETFTDIQ